jgi:hypothetical protein
MFATGSTFCCSMFSASSASSAALGLTDEEADNLWCEEDDTVQGTLFLAVAVENPTPQDAHNAGALSKVVAGPVFIVSGSRADAGARAMVKLIQQVPKGTDEDRLEVVVHPVGK